MPQQELHEQAVAHGGPTAEQRKRVRRKEEQEKSKEQGAAERNLHPCTTLAVALPKGLSVICGDINSKILGSRVGRCFP